MEATYFPVLGITLQHQRIFRLANLPILPILNLLHILLGLYPLILGESTMVTLLEYDCQRKKLGGEILLEAQVNFFAGNLMLLKKTYSSCMRQEVRSNGLKVSRCGGR